MAAAALTQAQLEELADGIADLLLDFHEVARLFPIRTKDASAGLRFFEPEAWHAEQIAFDRDRTGRDIVLKARQIGITTLELARDVWFARIHEGVQVLVVGHDPELVEQTFQDAQRFAAALQALGLAPKPKYSTKREIFWPDTQSTIRVIEAGETDKSAKKKGRSGTIHRLHCTEVAFWGSADETLAALEGALTNDAEVVIESTANGVGGRFHADVARAQAGTLEGYTLHFWPWHLHGEYRLEPGADFDPAPRDEWEQRLRDDGCDDAQLAWWRRKISNFGGGQLGLDKALQEYPVAASAAFRATGGQYISAAACDRIDRDGRAPLERVEINGPAGESLGELWVYARAVAGHQYVVAADIADGGGCQSAAIVMDRRSGEHAAVFASTTIDAGDFGHVLAALGRLYGDAMIAPERNNMGGTTLRALEVEIRYPRVYLARDKKRGWLTSATTRPVMWADLRRALEDGDVTTPDVRIAAELRGLIRGADGKPSKGPGSTDDLFMAWAIGTQLRLRGEAHQADDDKRRGSDAARSMGPATRARDLAY